jgi:hypothetical protein
MPLALIAIFVGYTLIYEAIHKEKPWSEILAAFGQPKQLLTGSTYTPDYSGLGDAPLDPGPGGGNPNPPPGGGGQVTVACNEFQAAVRQRWNSVDLSWRGDYVCKCIKGTCTPSQHSWGNAVDYWYRTPEIGGAFARWVVENKAMLKVDNFLFNEPSYGFTHTDFFPQGTGQPPCFIGGRPGSCVGC